MEARTSLEKSGRIMIPVAVRKRLGLEPGQELVLLVDEGVYLLTAEQAVKRAQGLVRKHVAEGKSLSQELIAERRDAAKRE